MTLTKPLIAVTVDTQRQIVEAVRSRRSTAAQGVMLLHLAYNRNKLQSR